MTGTGPSCDTACRFFCHFTQFLFLHSSAYSPLLFSFSLAEELRQVLFCPHAEHVVLLVFASHILMMDLQIQQTLGTVHLERAGSPFRHGNVTGCSNNELFSNRKRKRNGNTFLICRIPPILLCTAHPTILTPSVVAATRRPILFALHDNGCISLRLSISSLGDEYVYRGQFLELCTKLKLQMPQKAQQ